MTLLKNNNFILFLFIYFVLGTITCTYREYMPTSWYSGVGLYGTIWDENDNSVEGAFVLVYPPFDEGRGFDENVATLRRRKMILHLPGAANIDIEQNAPA